MISGFFVAFIISFSTFLVAFVRSKREAKQEACFCVFVQGLHKSSRPFWLVDLASSTFPSPNQIKGETFVFFFFIFSFILFCLFGCPLVSLLQKNPPTPTPTCTSNQRPQPPPRRSIVSPTSSSCLALSSRPCL